MTDLMERVWEAFWNGEGQTDAALARVVEVVKQDCRSQADAEIVAAAYRAFTATLDREHDLDFEMVFGAGYRAAASAAEAPVVPNVDHLSEAALTAVLGFDWAMNITASEAHIRRSVVRAAIAAVFRTRGYGAGAPSDAAWYREAVREMRNRARSAATKEQTP